MTETNPNEETAAEEKLPPYILEGARSSRSRCRTCRRPIAKDKLRLGILLQGPYGDGYLWHHLECAARKDISVVEEAYRLEAWNEAKIPPTKVPDLDNLRAKAEKAQAQKKAKKTLPYAELAPSGRSKCKTCGESIEIGSPRVALGRLVQFGQQTRTTPVNVHPACVEHEMLNPDAAFEPEELEAALRANSTDLDPAVLDEVLDEIGDLD